MGNQLPIYDFVFLPRRAPGTPGPPEPCFGPGAL